MQAIWQTQALCPTKILTTFRAYYFREISDYNLVEGFFFFFRHLQMPCSFIKISRFQSPKRSLTLLFYWNFYMLKCERGFLKFYCLREFKNSPNRNFLNSNKKLSELGPIPFIFLKGKKHMARDKISHHVMNSLTHLGHASVLEFLKCWGF